MSTPTASWSVDALWTSLSRNGWGELDGKRLVGVRRVLRALVDLCDHDSGYGTVTLGQITDTTGDMSTRWASRCMQVLESIGLITWDRGGLLYGQPVPGFVRISKRRLALLARGAKGHLTARRQARAEATRKRIRETLRLATQLPSKRPGRQNPLSVHAELSSPLSFTGESQPLNRGGAAPSPVENPSTPDERFDMVTPEPQLCPHGYVNHARCGRCRAERRGKITEPSPLDPPGECLICFHGFAVHTKRNNDVPVDMRHDWTPKR